MELLGGYPNDDAIVTSDGQVWSYSRLRDEVARHDGVVRNPRELLVGALARWQVGRPVVLAEAFPKVPIRSDAALVIQTTGARGAKKLVVLGAEGLLANIDAILTYLPVGRTAITLPFHHAYALVGQALVTLRAGGTVVLLQDLAYPQVQADAMRRLGVDGFSSVPSALAALAEIGNIGLRCIGSAGARLDLKTAHALRHAFPDATLFNQYGLTEAGPRVTAISDKDPAFWRGSVGKPLEGVKVQTIDGELFVNSPSVMLEYHDDIEGSAEALTIDGLRTGDLAEIVDEHVYITGRVDDLVKIGAERISLEEIARALQADADVVEVVLLQDARLVAAYVADGDRSEALKARAKVLLPPHKRPKRYVHFDSLPMLANGKVDIAKLRATLEAE